MFMYKCTYIPVTCGRAGGRVCDGADNEAGTPQRIQQLLSERRGQGWNPVFISHKVFLSSFCRSQLPHKSVNLSFTITNKKNKLTDLWELTFTKRLSKHFVWDKNPVCQSISIKVDQVPGWIIEEIPKCAPFGISESYLNNLPGHLWRDKRTALSGPHSFSVHSGLPICRARTRFRCKYDEFAQQIYLTECIYWLVLVNSLTK